MLKATPATAPDWRQLYYAKCTELQCMWGRRTLALTGDGIQRVDISQWGAPADSPTTINTARHDLPCMDGTAGRRLINASLAARNLSCVSPRGAFSGSDDGMHCTFLLQCQYTILIDFVRRLRRQRIFIGTNTRRCIIRRRVHWHHRDRRN